MVLLARAPSRRDELVAVALEVLERDGASNLSIGEIARLASIKPPSLYKQFTSKADIEARLIEHGFWLLADALAGRAATPRLASMGSADRADDFADDRADGSYRGRVSLFASRLRAFGHAHPQLYRLMFARPYPIDLIDADAEAAAVAQYRELVGDSQLDQGTWAWAHGLLSLELAGRLPQGHAGDALWQSLIDTTAGISTR
ncbi:TetR family transcriptional regulator [Homoserinimonas aerilata]|uniref:TetR family transcriptional regulator n=1 Tax=Homoserinimonas aerilata TaxID=1162970 RepID=A0A542YL17_9MICO|nr:TetR/AcrR family transcriptional regulator [Homoserinimonas aerilata]TQL48789.1 TetR family transcriptional regulator [Homoserinimonas aerilata]